MTHDLEVAYIGLEVPDPSSLSAFFGDVIGLVPGEPAGDSLTWRDDDRAQRVIVQPGAANDAVFLGFEATSAEAFKAVVERLAGAGYDVVDGDPAPRRVEQLARVAAPWGVTIEVVTGLATAEPFHSPLMPSGFLTEGVGFGHTVFATTAFDESVALLVDGLGMAQSDFLKMELAPGIELEVRFFHCNGRHHSVALAKPPFDLPQKLHHIMFETNSRDDVGAAFDRVWATDLPIPNGLGQHPNDGMFSFYVQSPAGFQVEVGYGGRVVGDDWDDNREYSQMSAWGHQALR